MQNPFLFPGSPQKFMGTEVIPLDPDTAKRVRFIPLYQLVYWLDKHSSADDAGLSCWELLCLAEHHIRAGHLKAYAPSLEFSHKSSSGIEECIWDGEVHEVEVTHIGGFEVKEQWHNPLLDIFEFTDWFREVNPDYLSLPDNWPAPEVDQANRPAQQSARPAPPEPTKEFRFNAINQTVFSEALKELAVELYGELGVNANSAQAWEKIKTWKPNGYQVSLIKRDTVEIMGAKLTRAEFTRKWKRYVG